MIERGYPPVKPAFSVPNTVIECDGESLRTGTKTGSELGVKPRVPDHLDDRRRDVLPLLGGAGWRGGDGGWREVVYSRSRGQKWAQRDGYDQERIPVGRNIRAR